MNEPPVIDHNSHNIRLALLMLAASATLILSGCNDFSSDQSRSQNMLLNHPI